MPAAKVAPELRAKALADLLAGDQPAVVAQRYGLEVDTVRQWKKRYVTGGVTDTTKSVTVTQPALETQKAHIGELIIDLLRAKLKASQAIADAVADPAWVKKQSAAELASLGQWLDGSAFAIGDRLAGGPRPDSAPDADSA